MSDGPLVLKESPLAKFRTKAFEAKIKSELEPTFPTFRFVNALVDASDPFSDRGPASTSSPTAGSGPVKKKKTKKTYYSLRSQEPVSDAKAAATLGCLVEIESYMVYLEKTACGIWCVPSAELAMAFGLCPVRTFLKYTHPAERVGNGITAFGIHKFLEKRRASSGYSAKHVRKYTSVLLSKLGGPT
jgi:hypothetical protein